MLNCKSQKAYETVAEVQMFPCFSVFFSSTPCLVMCFLSIPLNDLLLELVGAVSRIKNPDSE